jgi:hypothetical protein
MALAPKTQGGSLLERFVPISSWLHTCAVHPRIEPVDLVR